MCFLVYRADLVCREFERSTANQLSRYRINEKKIPFLERVAQMSTVFLQQRKESISLIDVRLFRSTVSIGRSNEMIFAHSACVTICFTAKTKFPKI